MRHEVKRLLSLALAVLMLFGAVPVNSVFAASTDVPSQSETVETTAPTDSDIVITPVDGDPIVIESTPAESTDVDTEISVSNGETVPPVQESTDDIIIEEQELLTDVITSCVEQNDVYAGEDLTLHVEATNKNQNSASEVRLYFWLAENMPEDKALWKDQLVVPYYNVAINGMQPDGSMTIAADVNGVKADILATMVSSKMPVDSDQNIDAQTDAQNIDAQTDAQNTDVQADAQNTDVQADVKNTDAQADVKNTDAQTDVKNTDAQTDVKNTDAQADVKNTDAQADVPVEENVQYLTFQIEAGATVSFDLVMHSDVAQQTAVTPVISDMDQLIRLGMTEMNWLVDDIVIEDITNTESDQIIEMPLENMPTDEIIIETPDESVNNNTVLDNTATVPESNASNSMGTEIMLQSMSRPGDITVMNDNGEHGSDIGGGGGSDGAAKPGSGSLVWGAPGVTMQVVLYPYKDCYQRNNSYDCVIDTLKNPDADSHGNKNTVFNGAVITPNTFVCDPSHGRVFKAPFLDINEKTFIFHSGDVGDAGVAGIFMIPMTESPTVSGPGKCDGSNKSGWIYIVQMPKINKIESFLQHLILGKDFGAWDVHDVKTSDSLYASVLRYLGVNESYITNYLNGYNGKLSVTGDANVQIPTIIWAYVVTESRSSDAIGAYDTVRGENRFIVNHYVNNDKQFYRTDPSSWGNDQVLTFDSNLESTFTPSYFQHSGGYGNYYGRVLTVRQIALGQSGSSTGFKSWWQTPYASPLDSNKGKESCTWDVRDSYACNMMFGEKHNKGSNHGYYTDVSARPASMGQKYIKAAYGSGYVNHINSDGVDSTSNIDYWLRGYWTPYGDKEEIQKGGLQLTKIFDKQFTGAVKGNSKYSLEGAVYKVVQTDNWGNVVPGGFTTTITTNSNGYAATGNNDLPLGYYTVTEVTPSAGCELDKRDYLFNVNTGSIVNAYYYRENGKWVWIDPSNVTYSEEPIKKGGLQLTKIFDKQFTDSVTNNSNYSLDGAVYKVVQTDNNGNVVSGGFTTTITTDSKGYATTGNNALPLGYYTVTEVTPSKGCELDKRDYLFNVSTNSVVNAYYYRENGEWIWRGSDKVTYSEEPIKKGGLQLTKIFDKAFTNALAGNSNYSLKGAVYKVVQTDNNGNVVSGGFTTTMTTDVNGYASTGANELPLGFYTVTEVTPSKGCKLDPREYLFNVNTTSKVNAYYYREDGVWVKLDASSTTYSEEPIDTGSVDLIKKSTLPDMTNGNDMYSLEGAEYQLYNADTKALVCTLVTDASGAAFADNIPFGNYYLIESKAPNTPTNQPSFELDESEHRFNITAENHHESVKIVSDEPPISDPGTLIITKKLDHGSTDYVPPLTGTEFTVTYYDSLDETGYAAKGPTRTWVFGVKWNEKTQQYDMKFNEEYLLRGDALYYEQTGNVTLPIGTYVIQETKAAKGYEIEGTITYKERDPNTGKWIAKTQSVADPFVTRVENANSGIGIMVDNVNMTNKASPITLKIVKTDTDQKPLKNVGFTIKSLSNPDYVFECSTPSIKNEAGEDVYYTNAQGELVFDKLEPGEYEIEEVETVNGNMLLKDPIVVSVPMKMTADDVANNNVDTNADSVKQGADGMYYVYEFTYNVTNTPTLIMPMTGGFVTAKTFLPLMSGMVLFGIVATMGFSKKKKKQ